jgi:hypothetical protein
MKLIIVSLVLLSASISRADYTRGYTRSNGTYVQGYHHTHADSNPYNNYSSVGNVNPYTGQAGTHQPQPVYYGSPNPNSNALSDE